MTKSHHKQSYILNTMNSSPVIKFSPLIHTAGLNSEILLALMGCMYTVYICIYTHMRVKICHEVL